LGVAAAGGCHHLQATYATGATALPVMLGPVKTLGARRELGAVLGRFTAETESMKMAAASTTQQGNYQITNVYAAHSYASASRFDDAVRTALVSCPRCSVHTERVSVGSYHYYWFAAIATKSWVRMSGAVREGSL